MGGGLIRRLACAAAQRGCALVEGWPRGWALAASEAAEGQRDMARQQHDDDDDELQAALRASREACGMK